MILVCLAKDNNNNKKTAHKGLRGMIATHKSTRERAGMLI